MKAIFPIDIDVLRASPLPRAMSAALLATQAVIPIVPPSHLIGEMMAINREACAAARTLFNLK